MSEQQNQRLGEIYLHALDLDPSSRERYLDRACAGDRTLRGKIESLLEDEDEAFRVLGRFLSGSETETLHPSFVPPERIGRYRVVDVLGEGGMGIVYLVEQEAPIRRRVALKVIKPGMDSRRVLVRFESERQTLALMNHPHIAQVFDAGATEEGRPYFVMEHVAGVPITEHCDRHRLTIDERLELFAKVCSAVQHAHQRGIIHRDIKPSNILVSFGDDGAVPKIIDFGVAKALDRRLTQDTVFTRRGELVGTPAYMSPEQVEMTAQDIDTRTDIYSLGVLLYQLLTGMLPFDNVELHLAGFDGMRRIIREIDPRKPSTKLSTVARKPDTASTLAQRRRLDDLRSLTHKIRDDLDWITMKCLEKDRSRRYASAENIAEDVRRYLENRPVEARPPSVTYRFRKWTRRHKGLLASIVLVSAVLLAGVATATKLYVEKEVAEADRDRYAAEEMVFDAGLLIYHYPELARKRFEEALALDPGQTEAEIGLVYLAVLKDPALEAVDVARGLFERHPESGKAAAMLSSLVRSDDPDEADELRRFAAERLNEAELDYALALGETDDRRAVELLTRSLERDPWQFHALSQRATRRYRLKDYASMLEDAELLVKVREDLAMAWILRGAALAGVGGRLPEALASFDEAAQRDPNLWLAPYNRAWADYQMQDFDEALTDLDRAAELAPDNPRVPRFRGDVLRAKGLWDEAVESYDRALALEPDQPLTSYKRGEACFEDRRFDEAADAFTKALEGWSDGDPMEFYTLKYRAVSHLHGGRLELARADYESLIETDPAATFYFDLGRVAMLEGDYEEAVAHFARAVELEPEGTWTIGRGIARWCMGDPAGASEDFRKLADVEGYESVGLWMWEIETTAGNASQAARWLAAADKISAPPEVRGVAPMLRGERAPAEIVAEAEASENDLTKLYAFYYAGSRAFALGKPEAEAWFRKAAELGMAGELEHDLAACHLAALQDLVTAP
jgi:serine/threonine protein kinase/predicted Zn-dependent protease